MPLFAADDLGLALFERYVDALRRQAGIPGMAATIVGETDIVWERGFGMQDVERAIPTRPDTPFQIDGLTQTLTAELVLRCAEEGRVTLDDRAGKYDGSFAEPNATLRQLLTHTSGPREFPVFNYDPDRLKYPLIRREKRGQEEWAQVSWDAALNRVAEKMQQIKAAYGPEAVALFSHGIGGTFTYSATDHAGLAKDAFVLVEVKNKDWVLVK